jgi:hypothetical protein
VSCCFLTGGISFTKNNHQEGPVYLRHTDIGSAMELTKTSKTFFLTGGDKLYKNSHQEGPVYLRLTDFGSAMELKNLLLNHYFICPPPFVRLA